jgi:hypothetical protein
MWSFCHDAFNVTFLKQHARPSTSTIFKQHARPSTSTNK